MDQTTSLNVAPELCMLRPEARSAEELLAMLAQRAVDAGYAATSFPEALLARERQYPTGLPLPTPAAIPHTDAVHVLRPALAVALLDSPVSFGEMGSADRSVSCRLAVMLLVVSPKDQVNVLGRVISGLQRSDWPEVLSAAEDPADLGRRFSTLIN